MLAMESTEEQVGESVNMADTLIFLDVDGVLNSFARMSASVHPGISQGAPIAPVSDISDVLAKRFAQIVRTAGSNVQVILSIAFSSGPHCRQEPAASIVTRLERLISKFMGRRFAFESTKLCSQCDGRSRLRSIGNAVSKLRRRRTSIRPLSVMVFDDFFNTDFSEGAMDMGDMEIRSPEEAADYIKQRYIDAADSADSPIRCAVIHTYSHMVTPEGFVVHIGTGLTLDFVSKAENFLHRGYRHQRAIRLDEVLDELDDETLPSGSTLDSERYPSQTTVSSNSSVLSSIGRRLSSFSTMKAKLSSKVKTVRGHGGLDAKAAEESCGEGA